MSTFTLEYEDGRVDYIAAANLSQARTAADGIAKNSKCGFKLRPATNAEEAALLASHSIDPSGPGDLHGE